MKIRRSLLLLPLVASCATGGDRASGVDTTDLPPADAGPAKGADQAAEAALPADDGAAPDADVPLDDPKLPHIDNFSGASNARVLALVKAALDGLGFDPAGNEGPSHDDYVFAGRYYIAWIDQTGFYGKMNGLFPLNGAAGDALDFALADPDGRPVNFFVPGEDGEGRWPISYKGAEHIEFPSRVPEPADDPACGQNGRVCNWYSLNEAPPITNTRIPWWMACNAGSAPFTKKIAPLSVQAIPGGMKVVYEGPLVKQADGHAPYTGATCHQDELFPDGTRHPVYARLGYELHGDQRYVDRTMQIRNEAGNPPFKGDMSLIGGFVMTGWPNAHYLKRFNRFWRPEQKPATVGWGGTQVVLQPSVWNDMHAQPVLTTDVLIGWAGQPISLSATNAYAGARSAQLAHVGPSDNDDVGVCLCAVHGGIEMGGGLIHEGISLPVNGGASTIEAKRRLTLPSDVPGGKVTGHPLAATTLAHKIGRADSGGWSASTGQDSPDHMVYGPYATDWGGGSMQAVFFLMVDNNSADDNEVVRLEVHDADTDTVLASRSVHRKELRAPFKYQRFAVNADLEGRAGRKIEVRVFWTGTSYVRIEKVLVHTSEY